MTTRTPEIATKAGARNDRGEWSEGPLRDFVQRVVGGGTPSRAIDEYWRGELPWASVKDLKDDAQYLIDTEEHISPAGLAKSAARIIEPGIPIVCTRMAVGRAACFRCATAINQDLKALYPNDKLEPAFLVLLLGYIRRQLESLSIGSTVKGIGVDQLVGVRVKVPAPCEQAEIVRVIDTVGSVVQQTAAIIAKLERIRSGLVRDLLARGIDERGDIRSDQTHRFKDSPIGRIPEGWRVGTLRAFGSRSRPYLKTGPFGSFLKGQHWVAEGQGVPVITIGAVGDEELIHEALMYISPAKARSLTQYVLKSGDLLFSRVADVGRSIVIGDHEDGWIMSSNFMRIALDEKVVIPRFLYLNFRYNETVLRQVRQFANAGGRDVVNSTVLNSLLIPWPKLDEQERIVEQFVVADEQIKSETNSLIKYGGVKRGLMQDLLSGKVRVSHLSRQ